MYVYLNLFDLLLQKLNFIIKYLQIFSTVLETFSVEEVYRKKCILTACKKLAEAEELWKAEQWQRCRDSCSQAILRVPLKSASPRELPKNMAHVLQGALLLRARCLLKEGKTQLAKSDVNTALQQGKILLNIIILFFVYCFVLIIY